MSEHKTILRLRFINDFKNEEVFQSILTNSVESNSEKFEPDHPASIWSSSDSAIHEHTRLKFTLSMSVTDGRMLETHVKLRQCSEYRQFHLSRASVQLSGQHSPNTHGVTYHASTKLNITQTRLNMYLW